MKDIELVEVKNAEELETLVKDSALTWEGMSTDESNLRAILGWIEERTPMKQKRVYVTGGKLANEAWHLTGSNAYPDDLNIVSVKLGDMEDYSRIVLARLSVGGRWMDDIKSNNLARECA